MAFFSDDVADLGRVGWGEQDAGRWPAPKSGAVLDKDLIVIDEDAARMLLRGCCREDAAVRMRAGCCEDAQAARRRAASSAVLKRPTRSEQRRKSIEFPTARGLLRVSDSPRV
eukprot:2952646-Rhodomonas_salina.1